MNPMFLQKPRNNFSVAGVCHVKSTGSTESDRKPVATVTVKTKDKDPKDIISNKKDK